jgi:hypothetical protein
MRIERNTQEAQIAGDRPHQTAAMTTAIRYSMTSWFV